MHSPLLVGHLRRRQGADVGPSTLGRPSLRPPADPGHFNQLYRQIYIGAAANGPSGRSRGALLLAVTAREGSGRLLRPSTTMCSAREP
jgi:hypothetical protein